tara:strand:- start:3446 stop:4603 length:1158 start_codon:yes stop_codon:yes gene_type:complete
MIQINNYASIHKANSIPFIELQEVNNISSFNNEINTFECNLELNIGYQISQVYSKLDKPCVQLKSNYKYNNLYLRKEDGTIELVPFLQKSSNLNKEIQLSGFRTSRNGKVALAFNIGNLYDPLTGDIIGTYDYVNKTIPFSRTGNTIELIGYGNFTVAYSDYSTTSNSVILIMEEDDPGVLSVPNIFYCNYNIIDYDVYEAYLDLTNQEGLIDLYIECADSSGLLRTFQSENIEVEEDSNVKQNYLPIYYYNLDNRNLVYDYKLINFCRFYCIQFYRTILQETELNIADNTVDLYKSDVNFGKKIVFDNLTENQTKALSYALSSDAVFIRGIGYVLRGDVSLDNIENTNLYTLEAELIETNIIFKLDNPRISLIDYLIPITIPES